MKQLQSAGRWPPQTPEQAEEILGKKQENQPQKHTDFHFGLAEGGKNEESVKNGSCPVILYYAEFML